jgi:hypothetical protein
MPSTFLAAYPPPPSANMPPGPTNLRKPTHHQNANYIRTVMLALILQPQAPLLLPLPPLPIIIKLLAKVAPFKPLVEPCSPVIAQHALNGPTFWDLELDHEALARKVGA